MTESSFRKLLLRLACIPIFALGVFLAILGFQLHEIGSRRVVGAHATSLLLQSGQIQNTLTDQETGIRGFLIADDPLFLQPYREASSRIGGQFAELHQLASSSQSLSPKIAIIDQSYQRFDELNRKLLQTGQSRDLVVALVKQQKQVMDKLRLEFADLNESQMEVRDINRNRLSVLFRRLPDIAIVGGILLALLVMWYGVTLFREITRAFGKQLEESGLQRDYLQTTLQSIGDGVVVCDDYGKITVLNPTAEELTGWPERDAIGRSLAEVFRVVNEYTRLLIENPVDKVWRLNTVVNLENHALLIRRDGVEIPIDDSGAPIRNRDGSLSGIVLVFRSVAERRRAANLLRQSQQRLNSIYDTSLEYIGLLDVEGRVLECNRASLEFAGNTRDQLIGKYYWECPWFIYTPGLPEKVQAAVQRGADGKATRTEMNLVRPSGDTIRFDFALNPVLDADGRVIYLVPEGRDISDLKRAESALLQSEKLAAVGRLATSIAHEINNPLEAVTNLLYLARMQSDHAKIEEYLKSADQELRRVSVIANQTLRFHKQASNPQPIQVDELFSTVLSIYEGKLRNSHISVEVSHRVRGPIVCFSGDVRQVLNNLVGNAIDAMSSGGRLLIRSHSTYDWASNRKGFVLTVADTGSGIAHQDLEHIFEPFFTTKGIGGTGLGLWVSKEVVARHSGMLSVRSTDTPHRSGTVFRLFLPIL